jgi:hypothetical protein
MGKIVFMVSFLYIKISWTKLSLNVAFLSSFVGILEMLQSFMNQNNTLLDYCIIYMCIDFTT